MTHTRSSKTHMDNNMISMANSTISTGSNMAQDTISNNYNNTRTRPPRP